jgi:8-oxo-dGTP pyrophosphatase MutT (NUDIX family)
MLARQPSSTITTILQAHLPCREHYDIWYFFPVDREVFPIDRERLAEEFHEIRWMDVNLARDRVTDLNTLRALANLESLFSQAPSLASLAPE